LKGKIPAVTMVWVD